MQVYILSHLFFYSIVGALYRIKNLRYFLRNKKTLEKNENEYA